VALKSKGAQSLTKLGKDGFYSKQAAYSQLQHHDCLFLKSYGHTHLDHPNRSRILSLDADALFVVAWGRVAKDAIVASNRSRDILLLVCAHLELVQRPLPSLSWSSTGESHAIHDLASALASSTFHRTLLVGAFAPINLLFWSRADAADDVGYQSNFLLFHVFEGPHREDVLLPSAR